ncbi:MAG: pilus assembly protein N-terminal domain-containing protein, partial [Fluviibacter sp.]
MQIVAASCIGLLLSMSAFPIAAAPISSPASVNPTASNQIPGARAVSIALVTGKSRLHKFKDPVSRISIGDPTVADVMVVNPQELYLLGKKPGSTNVLVWHDGDKSTAIDVMVGADTAAVQALFKQLMPDQKQLRVTAAGESLVLSGQVSDAVKVQQAIQIAEEYSGKKVMNML